MWSDKAGTTACQEAKVRNKTETQIARILWRHELHELREFYGDTNCTNCTNFMETRIARIARILWRHELHELREFYGDTNCTNYANFMGTRIAQIARILWGHELHELHEFYGDTNCTNCTNTFLIKFGNNYGRAPEAAFREIFRGRKGGITGFSTLIRSQNQRLGSRFLSPISISADLLRTKPARRFSHRNRRRSFQSNTKYSA